MKTVNKDTDSKLNSKERSKKWREANKERVKEYRDEWRSKNSEHVAKYQKKYHKEYKLRDDAEYNTWVRNLRRNYKINPEDFNILWKSQEGKCAICNVTMEPRGRGKQSVVVDHCHYTGAIRGLLCRCCNTGIGNLRDNIDVFKSAIRYLEKHKL